MCFRLIPEFLDAMVSFDRYARRWRPDQWRGTRSDRQRVSSATRDIPPTGQKIKNTRVCSNRLGTGRGRVERNRRGVEGGVNDRGGRACVI